LARVRLLYSFPTRLGTPGIGTTAWNQVAGVARHCSAVTVICASVERPLPEGVRAIETLRVVGVKVPFRALGFMRAVKLHDARAAALLRRIAGELDLVHCWPLGAERTLTAAQELPVRGVLERPNAHTRFAFAAVEQVYRELGLPLDPSSPHYPRPERLAREEREYELADGILCPSDFVARSFVAEGVPESRLLRHQYGYDPARFSADAGPQAGRPFSVGFFGRGEPRKGLHVALRAWLDSGAADRGRFIIAGAIDPGYEELLRPQLAHPSVHRQGHVDDPAALMRDCDVLVLPSFEEGSALVTYEGRACGCVLAISDRTGAPAEDGVDALIHSAGDAAALAGHLRGLATDHELLERLRNASLERARHLTWADAGRALADAYGAALAR
jgi:glycosyltransferase involved in cell wall biosynthesis